LRKKYFFIEFLA